MGNVGSVGNSRAYTGISVCRRRMSAFGETMKMSRWWIGGIARALRQWMRWWAINWMSWRGIPQVFDIWTKLWMMSDMNVLCGYKIYVR